MYFLNKKQYYKYKKLCVDYKKYIELYNYYSDSTVNRNTYLNDITGEYAINRIYLENLIKCIINSSKIAGGKNWKIVLEAACNWTSYFKLKSKYNLKMSKDEFNKLYKSFFAILKQTCVREKILYFNEYKRKEIFKDDLYDL